MTQYPSKQEWGRPHTKLYGQDIVQRIANPDSYGIVLRCWHDTEDVPGPLSDPMLRPLEYGEVGVAFITQGGEREILPELELKLIDRTLQTGDYCKKAIDDMCSGIVIDVVVKGRVEHVISGERVPGWFTVQDFELADHGEIGDYVVYDDWLGQIIEVFDESIVEISSGQLVRLPELGSRLSIGTDILPQPSMSMQNIFGYWLGNQRHEGVDTVVAVKHTVYAITWLAVNQFLDLSEAEKKNRPQRFWHGEDVGKLTLIQGQSDLEMRAGDRVRLKKTDGLPSTKHGQEGDPAGIFHVQAFLVTETETTVGVMWQDGTIEHLKAIDVIPYLNLDEYDCWPGDHVVWKNEVENRPAIVQSVNAVDRTATVSLPETGTIELVPLLELDPHGTSDSETLMLSSSEGLGVRSGDVVFIHAENSTNGLEKPRVPRIGELEAWVRHIPLQDTKFLGWRKEMSDIGTSIAARRGSEGVAESFMRRPSPGDGSFTWMGEVSGLNLDGTVRVAHPDGSIVVYPLERLTRLYDGIEQLEDSILNEEMSDEDSYSETYPSCNMDGLGLANDGKSIGDVIECEEIYHYENDIDIDVQDSDDEGDVAHHASETLKGPSAVHEHNIHLSPSTLTQQGKSSSSTTLVSEDNREADNACSGTSAELSWKCFEVLPSAPSDHAFYSSTPTQPAKQFFGRLSKEYRILANSLPDSIVVRAYEDRTDLLRSLIIGPQNTPYEDAPFVIDWMLDSNFPNSPPIAHFLSWTNGNGRVNPNLYEEGKVCLSILGTWAGDRNEMWNPARSSLLQTLVSIQGLVLVKEPWFCEPAYDKLRGTEEGAVNSRLYNEKAYVLSRGFVRRALEIPPGSLGPELRWLYFEKGRLAKVLRGAYALVAKSKANAQLEEEEHDVAVPRLTAGGVIILERTLGKLQALSDTWNPMA